VFFCVSYIEVVSGSTVKLFQVVLISTLDELYTYVQPTQLPPEFGGCFDYDHRCWMKNRMVSTGPLLVELILQKIELVICFQLMEDFADQAVSLIESLEVYGVELSETELPNDVSSTETLIQVQESKTLSFKVKFYVQYNIFRLLHFC